MAGIKNGLPVARTKVSLCIVSYNSKDDIVRCLDSLFVVLDVSRIDLIVYISDNNSADRSGEYLANKYPNVSVIMNEKNAGYGYGHNKVTPIIDSKYHIILNPDIIFEEDAISKLVDYLEVNADIAIATPEIRNLDKSIQYLPRLYPKLRYVVSSTIPGFGKFRSDYTLSNKVINNPIDIQVCTGSFMMIRTEVFKKISGFDEKFFMYFEDFDLSIRANKYGRIVYNPKTYVLHDWHRDSKKSKKMFLISVRSMIRFYAKHAWSLS